jgi:hypothetical protein
MSQAKLKHKVMKKQATILLSLLLLFFASEADVLAQKTETEKKKQEEIFKKQQEQEIKKAQAEKERIEELYRGKVIDASTRRSELSDIERDFHVMLPDIGTGWSVAYPDGNISFLGGSQDSETLEFRKTVNESSFTKEFDFTVESDARKVSISVSGACKSGEIRIEIMMPGGKTYTEVLLDEYGSVNWNKSFSVDDEENNKTGKWSFNITAREATGNFRLSIRSY